MKERIEKQGFREWVRFREKRNLKKQLKIRETLESLFEMNEDDIIKKLQPIEDFLKDMKLLQEKLPNCKIIY